MTIDVVWEPLGNRDSGVVLVSRILSLAYFTEKEYMEDEELPLHRLLERLPKCYL
jgi:hypothetical protein